MSNISDILYDISPIFIQNILISIYGRRLYKQRYGKIYELWLNYYKEKNYSSSIKESENQLCEFLQLISYAKENSSFYREFYSHIDLREIVALDDIKKLPILKKETLRKNVNEICTVSITNAVESFTGGTTGKSLRVYFTKEDFQKRMAYLDAFKYKCGINNLHSSKKATFSGRSFAKGFFQNGSKIYWRYNKPYNQKLYSTFDMQPSNLSYYITDLNKFSPDIINGFVSAIYQLARYIIDNNINLSFTPDAIFTTSETLLTHHRVAIEQAFKSKIFNQYASAEGAPFITECIEGNLHYNLDTGIIEHCDDGSILITSFTSYGTPLIRYDIGDRVIFPKNKNQQCACGSSHPIVEAIDGRTVDYLYSAIKGRVSLSHLADVIKGIPNSIREMQFIQENIDEIKIKICVDKDKYKEGDKLKIISSMKYRFGSEINITILEVDQITKTKGGKSPLIINNLDD